MTPASWSKTSDCWRSTHTLLRMGWRKARGRCAGGRLKAVSAGPGATAIRGALEKAVRPESVDHVVMGYALQTCSQSIYGARHAGLKAGVPQEVPMLTLSARFRVQSIVTGAQMTCSTRPKSFRVVWRTLAGSSCASRCTGRVGLTPPPVEDYMMTNLQDMTCGLFMRKPRMNSKGKGVTREEVDARFRRTGARKPPSAAASSKKSCP